MMYALSVGKQVGVSGKVSAYRPRRRGVSAWVRAIFLSVVAQGGVFPVGAVEWQGASGALSLDMRRHGSLFEGLAEPPPGPKSLNSSKSDEGFAKALSGFPAAPSVFSGVLRVIGPHYVDAGDYLIADRAVIHVDDGARANFAGTIANAPGSLHGLVKLGAGLLALSGHNTYTGPSYLMQGGLEARSDWAWGDGALHAVAGTRLDYAPGVVMQGSLRLLEGIRLEDVAPAGSYGPVAPPAFADSVRWHVASGVAVQEGTLDGTVPFVKLGAGRLDIRGDSLSYKGAVRVHEGALAANDFLGGPVRVGNAARLEGAGAVAALHVEAGGTVAPGNRGAQALGRLVVTGDARFEPGARFEVDVAPDGAGDSLFVAGKAVLAGDVVALAKDGIWKPSVSYTVLTAAQGLEGSRFDSVAVSGDFAFLTPELSYAGDAVTLTLARNGVPLDEAAETPDDKAVAEVVEQAPPPLHDRVLGLSLPAAREAFRQLAGSWAASVASGMLEDSRFVREAILDHAHGGAGWGRVLYSDGRRAGHGSVWGDARTVQGLLAGGTQAVGDLWLGGALGVQQAKAQRRDAWAEARTDGLHLGASLAGVLGAAGQLRWTVGAAHTWHHVRSARRVAVGGWQEGLSSRYPGRLTQGFAELSRPVARVAPYVRLAYVRADLGAHQEHGGDAALSLRSARHAVWFTTLGLRARHDFSTRNGMAHAQAQFAWRHAAGAVQAVSRQSFLSMPQAAAFESQGLPTARNAFALDLALAGSLSKRVSLSMAYGGLYARGLQDHGIRLNLFITFA